MFSFCELLFFDSLFVFFSFSAPQAQRHCDQQEPSSAVPLHPVPQGKTREKKKRKKAVVRFGC